MKWMKLLPIVAVVLCCIYIIVQSKSIDVNASDDPVLTETKSDSMASSSDTVDHTAEMEEQAGDDSLSGQGSLNDIRFANFKTNRDWLDNEYIRTLRRYLDDYTAEKVENTRLEPYKEGLKSKFVVYDTEPFIAGGLLIRVIFLDMPDKVFAGTVYSFVDEDTKTVTGYECRGLHLETEESGFTKEEILQGVKETPDLKLW